MRLCDCVIGDCVSHQWEQTIANLLLLCRWYTRDDNAVPAAYTLASISAHIPDFLSLDRDKQKVAKEQVMCKYGINVIYKYNC